MEENIIKDDSEDEKIEQNNKEEKKDIINYKENFYEDDSKKLYKINNNPSIDEISILKTKNSPPTRVYLTAEYSLAKNRIICIGGTDKSCEQYNKISEYSIKDNIWHIWDNNEQSEFEFELSGHSSNLINLGKGEQIFIYGGYDNFKNEFTSQSYFLNVQNRTFEKIYYNSNNNNDIYPLPRSYHSSNYDKENQTIIIYGGTDMNINHSKDSNFQSVWIFHLIDKTWEQIEITKPPDFGAPRGHSAILVDNILYIFGGIVLFKRFLNLLYTINLKEKTIKRIDYAKKGVSPNPTAFHNAVLIDKERFLVHGGLDKNYNTINDTYIFNITNSEFTRIFIPLIPNIFGHKIVINKEKNKLYFLGGMDSFKYVGDENLIYKIVEDKDDIFNNNVGQVDYFPMKNILEISLNQNDNKEKNDNIILDNKEYERHKKRKWIKLYIPGSN